MINREHLAMLGRESSDKRFARSQARIAVAKGILVKETCYCGETKVEGHHVDYSKPLEVIWACRKHHAVLDKMRREEHIS